MCVGVPMRVIEAFDGSALAEGRDGICRVNTLLVGAVAPGDWLLVHVDNAIRLIDAAEAKLIADALAAVAAAMAGESFEHLIADLIDREPPLPPHLSV